MISRELIASMVANAVVKSADSPLHKLHFYPLELENFSKWINLPFRINIYKQ